MAVSHTTRRLLSTSPPQLGIKVSCIARGTKRSMAWPTSMPWKPAAATPITVIGRPFKETVWSRTAGSPPNRRCQKPWLNTTRGWAPGVRSSSALNTRPRAAPTPSTSK